MPFTIHVKKRPGVEIFLEKVCDFFEVVIYTASLSEVGFKFLIQTILFLLMINSMMIQYVT